MITKNWCEAGRGVGENVKLGVKIGFGLGSYWVCIGFGLGLDWVRIGFAFFVFFWTALIVSPYHSKCYRQSGHLKIGFVWHIKVLSAFGGISWFAKGGQNVKCEMKKVKLWKQPGAVEIISERFHSYHCF